MTIKELRTMKKLSQSAFAKAIGIGVSTIGAYENGRFKPSDAIRAKIKEVYDVDIDGAETAVEAAPAEKPAPKKAAKKKAEAAAPAEKKAATRKKAEPAKNAEKPAKNAAGKKAAKPAAEPEPAEKPVAKQADIIIQSPLGGEITPADILARIGEADRVYIRVDENKAYWVRGEESGSIDLWD